MDYLIGQLAKSANTDIETIRFYERRGLIPAPPRTSGGYRRYPAAEADRLRFIRRAKVLGFTLNEIGPLLKLQEGGDRHEVKSVAQTKLSEIEARIADLQSMRYTLTKLVNDCSGRGPVAGCPIIEALNSEEPHDA